MDANRREILKASMAASTLILAGGASADQAESKPAEVPALPPSRPATSPALRAVGKVAAKVDQRLLTKASRFFAGRHQDRVCELLQNARRAGATHLHITSKLVEDDKYLITIEDNGHGIEDFGQLLTFGFSGWSDETEAAEDPAGAGFFVLAPRTVLVQSRGREVTIEADTWLGVPAVVRESEYTGHGVRLQFVDEDRWTGNYVGGFSRFSGVSVTVNDELHESRDFLLPSLPTVHLPQFGVRVQHVPPESSDALDGQSVTCSPLSYRARKVVLNFYGVRVELSDYADVVGALPGMWLVDMTGEPTELRLQLPDRNRIIANQASEALLKEIELEAYRVAARQPQHALSYNVYARGVSLGVALPESVPCWDTPVGDWSHDSSINEDSLDLDAGMVNCDSLSAAQCRVVDLAYAAGVGLPDLRPVNPAYGYNQYNWTRRIPRLTNLEVIIEDLPDDEMKTWDDFRGGSVTLVKAITGVYHVEYPDGQTKVYTRPLPIAIDDEDEERGMDYAYVATREGLLTQVKSCHLFEAVGGWHEDCEDSYDVVSDDFDKAYLEMVANLQGPLEWQRRALASAAHAFRRQLVAITQTDEEDDEEDACPVAKLEVYSDGTVEVQFKNSAPSLRVTPASAST